MIGEDLLRYKKDQKYMVFDAETENLNLYTSRPWQLAWIICKGDNILESHDYLLKFDDLAISKKAALLTHFNERVYRENAIDPCVVLERFCKYLYDPEIIVMGHNILGFDVYQLNNLFRSCNKKYDYSYLNRLIDTNCIAKAIKLGMHTVDRNELLAWQYRLVHTVKRGLKTNLGLLARESQIPLDETKLHMADYDIVLNYKIWNKLKWLIEI